MKDSSLYPIACVPSSVLNNASHINDIRDRISYDIVSLCGQIDIYQYYEKDDIVISLWFCRNIIYPWSDGRIDIFHTANLTGVNNPLKLHDQLFFRTHVLASPIKYLGKELFGQSLDFFQQKWMERVFIIPLKPTDSRKFYMKMIDAYSNRLRDVYVDPNDDIVLLLKSL